MWEEMKAQRIDHRNLSPDNTGTGFCLPEYTTTQNTGCPVTNWDIINSHVNSPALPPAPQVQPVTSENGGAYSLENSPRNVAGCSGGKLVKSLSVVNTQHAVFNFWIKAHRPISLSDTDGVSTQHFPTAPSAASYYQLHIGCSY